MKKIVPLLQLLSENLSPKSKARFKVLLAEFESGKRHATNVFSIRLDDGRRFSVRSYETLGTLLNVKVSTLHYYFHTFEAFTRHAVQSGNYFEATISRGHSSHDLPPLPSDILFLRVGGGRKAYGAESPDGHVLPPTRFIPKT